MAADLILFNNPLELSWQSNLIEALKLGLFVLVTVYAVVQFRRGTRIYLFVVVTTFIYGVALELAGMATVNLYVQAPFTVMLNFPALPVFENTTAMPLYVSIYYPVIFMIGFKVVEALGVTRRWQAAIVGGLFMICQEAPFVIEGALSHVRWFTWHDNPLLQFFAGWPLVDMYWQMTWGALYFWLLLRARDHLDGSADGRWASAGALGWRALLTAGTVLVVGPLLFAPVYLATATIGVHWPVLVVAVGAFFVITVAALRTACPPQRRVAPFTAVIVGFYVMSFVVMVAANVVYDGGVTQETAVQATGLLGMLLLATFPVWASHPLPREVRIPDRGGASAPSG